MVLVQPILLKGQIHDGLAVPELFVRQLVQILGRIDPEFLVQLGEGRRYSGGPAEMLLSKPRRKIFFIILPVLRIRIHIRMDPHLFGKLN
jgi:hypothetical protein